ncbi:MAG: hypothetical protein Q9M28_03750 [Mariprofundaceae bacterium]|nr:hypothetical protein [Mariprofundaceae bacterium]
MKNTALTVDLAKELNTPLAIGKIVEQRYRQADERYKCQDNHGIVIKLTEEDNNMDLRVDGFVVPSKYGSTTGIVSNWVETWG